MSPVNRSRRKLVDYRARMHGRFENSLGAHAGFTGGGLIELTSEYFSTVRLVTGDYLRFKYGGKLLSKLGEVIHTPNFVI